jgi:hypothetical protein
LVGLLEHEKIGDNRSASGIKLRSLHGNGILAMELAWEYGSWEASMSVERSATTGIGIGAREAFMDMRKDGWITAHMGYGRPSWHGIGWIA